jgi:hypothetical protein
MRFRLEYSNASNLAPTESGPNRPLQPTIVYINLGYPNALPSGVP